MKRDGRGFDHGTLETIRLMAVERVRDGERPSSVVASYGFNRTNDLPMAQRGGNAGCGTESAARQAGDGSATQFDATSGEAGVSLDQWSRSVGAVNLVFEEPSHRDLTGLLWGPAVTGGPCALTDLLTNM
jgi:hypothetical protein